MFYLTSLSNQHSTTQLTLLLYNFIAQKTRRNGAGCKLSFYPSTTATRSFPLVYPQNKHPTTNLFDFYNTSLTIKDHIILIQKFQNERIPIISIKRNKRHPMYIFPNIGKPLSHSLLYL